MTMEVLQDKTQISSSRQELFRRGLSFTDSSLLLSLMRRLGIVRNVAVGDRVKSWDVNLTLNFIERYLQKDKPILDIGSYASEVIVALHKLGYSNLTGVDLNKNLKKMPYSDSIRYEISDFMKTPFQDASFQAITSISVIEHGFNARSLLGEMSRLLMPGGFFISSFDYWPDKIDTTGVKIFGLDWMIFSKAEIMAFIELASEYGLAPVGEINYDAKNPAIDWGGERYTFGWLALKKRGC